MVHGHVSTRAPFGEVVVELFVSTLEDVHLREVQIRVHVHLSVPSAQLAEQLGSSLAAELAVNHHTQTISHTHVGELILQIFDVSGQIDVVRTNDVTAFVFVIEASVQDHYVVEQLPSSHVAEQFCQLHKRQQIKASVNQATGE